MGWPTVRKWKLSRIHQICRCPSGEPSGMSEILRSLDRSDDLRWTHWQEHMSRRLRWVLFDQIHKYAKYDTLSLQAVLWCITEFILVLYRMQLVVPSVVTQQSIVVPDNCANSLISILKLLLFYPRIHHIIKVKFLWSNIISKYFHKIWMDQIRLLFSIKNDLTFTLLWFESPILC